jgi:hypothetical protein
MTLYDGRGGERSVTRDCGGEGGGDQTRETREKITNTDDDDDWRADREQKETYLNTKRDLLGPRDRGLRGSGGNQTREREKFYSRQKISEWPP